MVVGARHGNISVGEVESQHTQEVTAPIMSDPRFPLAKLENIDPGAPSSYAAIAVTDGWQRQVLSCMTRAFCACTWAGVGSHNGAGSRRLRGAGRQA